MEPSLPICSTELASLPTTHQGLHSYSPAFLRLREETLSFCFPVEENTPCLLSGSKLLCIITNSGVDGGLGIQGEISSAEVVSR
jgi:hypothetical protein